LARWITCAGSSEGSPQTLIFHFESIDFGFTIHLVTVDPSTYNLNLVGIHCGNPSNLSIDSRSIQSIRSHPFNDPFHSESKIVVTIVDSIVILSWDSLGHVPNKNHWSPHHWSHTQHLALVHPASRFRTHTPAQRRFASQHRR
jgi:hypothetical protein